MSNQINFVLQANVEKYMRAMDAAQKRMEGFVAMSSKMKDVGQSMSLYLSVPIAAMGAASLKTFASLQSLKMGLTAVEGSAAIASAAFKALEKTAQLPGLGLKEAVQGYTNLRAVGFEAEKSRAILETFGNALATVGKGKAELDGVVTALSQMQAKGKVSAEEINQIAERVPQIRKAMQEAFGTADTESLQKAGISVDQFVNGVTASLGKLPQVTGGLTNAFENFGDSTQITLAKFGDAINKTFNIEGLLTKFGDAIANVGIWFEGLNPTMQKTIVIGAGLVAAIGPVVAILGSIGLAMPAVIAGATMLGTAFKSLAVLASPLVIKVVAITAAVGGLVLIAKSVYDSWGAVSNFFSRMWDNVKLMFANGVLSVAKTMNKFTSVIGLSLDGPIKALENMKATAEASLDATPYVSFGDMIGTIGSNITANMNNMLNSVKGFFSSTSAETAASASEIENTAKRIKNALDSVNGGSKQPTYEAPIEGKQSGVVNSAAPTADPVTIAQAFEAIPVAIAPAEKAMDTFYSKLKDHAVATKDIGANLASLATALMDTFSGALSSMAENLGAGMMQMKDIGKGLLSALASMGKQAGQFFVKMGLPMLLTGNPVGGALIAAGIALSAFSGSMGAAASKGAGGGGIAPRISSNFNQPGPRSTYSPSPLQPQRIEIYGRLNGRDIELIRKQESSFNKRFGG